MSTSNGDLSCADPSNVSLGPLAKTHSPTSYDSKETTEESNSILVKSMFFHRLSMTSTRDSPESIATLPPESDWDDEQIRNLLASPLYLQKREASADRSRVYHSFSENSMSSSSHFRESAGKPAAVLSHKRKSRPDTFSDRDGISSGHQPVQGKRDTVFSVSDPEEASTFVFEEHSDHLLAEAKSEILKQECKVDSLNTWIREFQRQTQSHRLELNYVKRSCEKE